MADGIHAERVKISLSCGEADVEKRKKTKQRPISRGRRGLHDDLDESVNERHISLEDVFRADCIIHHSRKSKSQLADPYSSASCPY